MWQRGGQCSVTLPLLSVPYALKAADARTLGGLPPSAFALAPPSASASGAGIQPAATTAKGTVTSVGLSAPVSDFTVSGSPVTTSGTLELNWNVAPTNADTASAIVNRHAHGSFTAGAITASLGMEGVTTTASGNSVAGINDRGGTAVYGGGNTGVGVWGQSFGTGDMQVRGQKPGMKSFALEFFSSSSQRLS